MKKLQRIIPIEISSMNKSASDNIRWRITTEEGDILSTEVDSDAAYAVSRNDVGRPVNVALNDAGRIVLYEVATSTALDAEATREHSAGTLQQIETILDQDGVDPVTAMAAITRHVKHWDYATHEQAARRKAERVARREFYNLPAYTH